MLKHLRYLSYVLRHKAFVAIECCKVGLIWRGLVHDWHKFLPSEWFPYTEHFYGKLGGGTEGAFDFAWLLHQKRADHHWQWWIIVLDNKVDCHKDEGKLFCKKCGHINTVRDLDTANAAVSGETLKTSRTRPDNIDSCAESTGRNTALSNERSSLGTDTGKSATREIQKDTRNEPENRRGRGESVFFSTTEEILRSALAVVKSTSSSLQSTTSMGEETSIGSISRLKATPGPFDGSSRTSSLQDSVCSATTATQLSGTTATVRIIPRRCEKCGSTDLLPKDDGGEKILPMSPEARLEMVCDWCGASRAQGYGGWQGVLAWYEANKNKMRLHPDTKAWVSSYVARQS